MPGETVFSDARRGFGGRIEVNGEVSAVFEKLDTGQRRAEKDVERFPLTSLAKGAAESLRGVAKKVDHRHAAKEAAFEENEVGVEMADDRALDLRKPRAHFGNLREVRQRRGIVAKQDGALGGRQIGEGATYLLDVPCE